MGTLAKNVKDQLKYEDISEENEKLREIMGKLVKKRIKGWEI